MSIRVLAAAVLLLLAGVQLGAAQSVPAKRRAPPPGPPSVTIMTDGLAATASGSQPSADQALAELAGALGQDQSIRLMPVMGFGAVANMRDLLQTRGVDLAVVNADILAYLRQSGLLPSAPARVRSIGRLLDKTVYLLAASEVGSIDELSGAAVGVIGAGSEAEVTARTVFAGLGIGIELRPVAAAQVVPGLIARQLKAVLLLAGPDDRPLAQIPPDGGLHLLALPLNQKLAEIYEPVRLSAGDGAGLVPAEGLDTLRVASVLATYNWRPGQRRYGNVVTLLERLPAAVAELRRSGAGRRWLTFDASTPIKGWQAFEPARLQPASRPRPNRVRRHLP